MINLKNFNSERVLMIITSFPQRGGEVAVENAVARYSKLLIESFPKSQKVLIVCEKRTNLERPYLAAKNILVVPSYHKNSYSFFWDLIRTISSFGNVKNILLQFEFSVFGGKIIIPQILALMFVLKIFGRNLTVVFHQVTLSLSDLSGHLGLVKNSIKTRLLDFFLTCFYRFAGILASNIIVHDQILKNSLARSVDKNRIYVIPHGMGDCINPRKSEMSYLRGKLGISWKQKVVLAFGYNSWYKGTDWIVKAFNSYKRRDVRLVLAGGESPTLKTTLAYKRYFSKLKSEIKNSKNVIATGFLPESNVPAMFGLADIVVFPYRARMSASGALALAFSYGRPILVSRKFSENFTDSDIVETFEKYGFERANISFLMDGYSDFYNKLGRVLKDKKMTRRLQLLGYEVATNRKWENAGLQYIKVCTKAAVQTVPATSPSLAYAQEV